jgi:hypothetical protein
MNIATTTYSLCITHFVTPNARIRQEMPETANKKEPNKNSHDMREHLPPVTPVATRGAEQLTGRHSVAETSPRAVEIPRPWHHQSTPTLPFAARGYYSREQTRFRPRPARYRVGLEQTFQIYFLGRLSLLLYFFSRERKPQIKMPKYAQLVIGPAGSGKSTYCSSIFKHCDTVGRTVHVVNLDPAAEHFDYPVAIGACLWFSSPYRSSLATVSSN